MSAPSLPHSSALLQALLGHYETLVDAVRRRFGDRAFAQEVVNELCVRLLEKPAMDEVRDPRALLRRMAMHLAIDRYRASARSPEVALEPDALDGHPGPQAALSAPELAVAAAQRHRALLAAIEQLPPVCRDAFILTKLYALTQDQAAARLGVSRGMVARHLARALQDLQPVLFDGCGPA